MAHAIETFFGAWGDPDAQSRAQTLRDCLSAELHYVDPRTPEPITDISALIDYVAMYSQYAPGASAKVVALSDTKGAYRATVEFLMSDGKQQFGQYFVEVDAEARPRRMVGFVGLGAPE